MAIEEMDCMGLKCPQPLIKVSMKSLQMKSGDILEVTADCVTFEQDIRTWCQRSNKVLLSVKDLGGGKKLCQLQF